MNPETSSNQDLIYNPETPHQPIVLSPEQKTAVQNITLGIEQVDQAVREADLDDVAETLENGHPLNRVIEDEEGKISGYIACEDFTPGEAYIKYFGTSGQTGRNLFREIPAFFEYARSKGYSKLNFHGWNPELNRVLERFGFERIRTDSIGEFSADLYEKSLLEQKSQDEINEERKRAFEQKYLNKINREYKKTLATFSQEKRPEKEEAILSLYNSLASRLNSTEEFDFNEISQAVLKLKLARHFQTLGEEDKLDENVLFDAIVESPRFLQSDKGSLHRLFELHEQKTLQKIAEIRKNRAEMTGNEGFNPMEALFETSSENYYVARLLNMPHLEQESAYMNHCVGTSDSYINKIKRGEIEILSFRSKSVYNNETGQAEGEQPIITIEYNLKTNTIEQMKKANDTYLSPEDPYFDDVIDALKTLRQTTTDTGKSRDFRKINNSELGNFRVRDYCLLTEQGEISFRDFDPEGNVFVLKIGEMAITPNMPKQDVKKILRIVEGIIIEEDELALGESGLYENSKVYLGPIFKELWHLYPNLEHIYSKFPEGRVSRGEYETTGASGLQQKKEVEDRQIITTGNSEFMLQSPEFMVANEGEKILTVRLQVRALFSDENVHTYSEILARANELGLDELPHETAANLIQDEKTQPEMNSWYTVVSKPITGRGSRPTVVNLGRDDGGLYLSYYWALPDYKWIPHNEFLFAVRKPVDKTSNVSQKYQPSSS